MAERKLGHCFFYHIFLVLRYYILGVVAHIFRHFWVLDVWVQAVPKGVLRSPVSE